MTSAVISGIPRLRLCYYCMQVPFFFLPNLRFFISLHVLFTKYSTMNTLNAMTLSLGIAELRELVPEVGWSRKQTKWRFGTGSPAHGPADTTVVGEGGRRKPQADVVVFSGSLSSVGNWDGLLGQRINWWVQYFRILTGLDEVLIIMTIKSAGWPGVIIVLEKDGENRQCEAKPQSERTPLAVCKDSGVLHPEDSRAVRTRLNLNYKGYRATGNPQVWQPCYATVRL